MNNLNSFVVKYFYDGKTILDTSVNHWAEYVAALKVSDKVRINDEEYHVEDICMDHVYTKNGLTVELNVVLNK